MTLLALMAERCAESQVPMERALPYGWKTDKLTTTTPDQRVRPSSATVAAGLILLTAVGREVLRHLMTRPEPSMYPADNPGPSPANPKFPDLSVLWGSSQTE